MRYEITVTWIMRQLGVAHSVQIETPPFIIDAADEAEARAHVQSILNYPPNVFVDVRPVETPMDAPQETITPHGLSVLQGMCDETLALTLEAIGELKGGAPTVNRRRAIRDRETLAATLRHLIDVLSRADSLTATMKEPT